MSDRVDRLPAMTSLPLSTSLLAIHDALPAQETSRLLLTDFRFISPFD
ncbi:hypothetical protein EXA21_03675 [Vibrio cincinnatiensis]|nr:hypothetical protein [Vibrio cincinnatiensis]MCG3762012.1 hypothetical protein [Vibrio cincinnatiensis]